MPESSFHIWANELRARGDAEEWKQPIELTGTQVLALLECIDFYREAMRSCRESTRYWKREFQAARSGEWMP